uniref:6-hydroxynicotinate 3-monooxygenase n=1 Tax=Talaromyces marneffei PM1 TaxID=1077442 RepID=A0A093XNQ2_TALMA
MAAQPDHFLVGKRIIVAGGSFAGLSFILALEKLWNSSLPRPEILMYEYDARVKSIEKDPYMLNINGFSQDGGLVTIQDLGLLDDVRKYGTLNSGDIRVWSDNWKWLSSINPTAYGNLPAATIRITRENLKRILVQSAETTNTTLHWESAFTISDGTTQDCDLLVAADGADSNIRACFRPKDMKTKYAGATQIGGISRLTGLLPKPIDKDYVLQMSSGEGVCCIYNPFDKDTIAWAISTIGPEREAKTNFNEQEFETLKKEALETASMFQEPFKTVVEATIPNTAFIRPAKEKYAFRHGDTSLKGVIFIGDANHILSPYEFVGANLALKDGWDLAEQICRNGSSLDSAAASYDRRSFARFDPVFKFSHERIGFGHSTGKKWLFYKYGMAAQRKLKQVH